MHERIYLDTSAYSNFKRGHSEVVEIISRAKTIYFSTVVLGEIYTGFLLGSRQLDNDRELALFINNSVVEVVPVNQEIAQRYAEILVDLKKRGTPIPTNDIWIAAGASILGATLITFDAHFSEVKAIQAQVLSLSCAPILEQTIHL